jgi:uncharacterized membrane protein YgcG
MIRKYTSIAATVVAALAAAMPVGAQPDLQVDFLYEAEKKLEVHASELDQALVVNFERSEPHLCAVYGNNLPGKQKNKGNVIADFQIIRMDPETGEPFVDPDTGEPVVEELRLRGQIKGGVFLECAEIDPLNADDVVLVEYTFNKMPRLREASDGSAGAFRVVSVLAEEEKEVEDFLPEEPAACTVDDGGSNGGGGGGGSDGGGGGSGGGGGGANNTANNQRAAQILRGCAGGGVGIQFQWDQGRQKVDRRDGGGNIATIGPFASYLDAALAADSRWKCGAGSSVSSDDGAQMSRLLTWGGVSGRRLALRFESTGGSGVYVDAYSSGTGAIHGSRFSTISAAIRNFCGRPGIGC